jgi:uncharacterized protein YjbI with pentapeptide repeats
MANEQQLAMLRSGVREWNVWRKENPEETVDLSKADLREVDLWDADLHGAHLHEADLAGAQLYRADLHGAHLHRTQLYRAYLSGADLSGVDLSEATLRKANLIAANVSGANLIAADLSEADLREAQLQGAYLSGVRFSGADLSQAILRDTTLSSADLSGANLTRADLSGSDLSEADLSAATCIGTTFDRATLTGCRVFGSTMVDVHLEDVIDEELCITPRDQPAITVDHLAVAQFIALMLNNQRVREVVDGITGKIVLVIGGFSVDRKALLDVIRDELRQHGYMPVVLDFDVPAHDDMTEMIGTLARMARFIVIDLTDAENMPPEMAGVVASFPSLPVQPLLEEGGGAPAWWEAWRRLPGILDLYMFSDLDGLAASLHECVIAPAEHRVKAPVS